MDDVARIAKEWWLLAVLGVVSLVCGVLERGVGEECRFGWGTNY